MLTADGCRARRKRLLDELTPTPEWVVVGDARHVMYLTNFPVEPISWSSPPPVLLLIERSGRATLVTDNLAVRRRDDVWVERFEIVPWYNQTDSVIDRRLAVLDHFVRSLPHDLPESVAIEARAVPVELVRQLTDELSERAIRSVDDVLLKMRRTKDSDELELIRRSVAAGEAGHARAWHVVRPGVTELEVYREIASACTEVAGQPVIVYGDFCSGPRTWTDRGGPPTRRRLEAGDTMILDFSVVLGGYRSDFTNTIAVGSPSDSQRRLAALCRDAMQAGEEVLRAGRPACKVWAAVNRPLESAQSAYRLNHHAGHGIGLAHPEPPIMVPKSADTLVARDIVTLEPGVYVEQVGGMRFENNYLVTDDGCERLTHHVIGLDRSG